MSASAPPALVIDALVDGSARVTRRVEVLNADGTVFIESLDILEGSISVDASRDERRTFEVSVSNTHGDVVVGAGGLWYDKILVPYRGVTYPDPDPDAIDELTWEVPLGRFLPDSFLRENFPADIHITARDFTKKLMTAGFEQTTAFTWGSTVESIVRGIAVAGGVTQMVLPWYEPDNPSPIISATRIYETDTSRWDAIKEICTSFGFDVFFDVFGYMVVAPQADPALDSPVWTFQTGEEGNLITYSRAANDSRLYNAILVKGEKEGQAPVSAFVEIEDTENPLHKSRIGQRLYRYTSSFISDAAQALQVATNFLQVHGLEEFEIDLGAIVFPWLDAGTTIAFVDPEAETTDRFFMHDLAIPLALEPMTVNGRRVRIVQ